MKILVVDDSRAMRAIIRHAIRQMGLKSFTFLEASNGREALEMVTASPVDLVICDYNMPEMNGFELLQALHQSGKKIRFGFITSDATARLQKEALEEGSSFILTKPFNQASFSETVGPILAQLGSGTLYSDNEPEVHSAIEADGNLALGDIARVLRSLIRLRVQVSESKPIPLPPGSGTIVAEYRAGDSSVAGCALCDTGFATHVASSLSMIPRGTADDALKTGRITDVMWENLHEILNVASRLLDPQGLKQVVLNRIFRPGEALAPELVALISQSVSRVDVCVNVETYEDGNLTILAMTKQDHV
jgi:two-component system chemotaxis response regulator CheY